MTQNLMDEEYCRLHKEMLLFKVDFEKAYDSVDLNYLDTVMQKMNFLTLWRKMDFRKISWVDWDSVCLPREEGGLGVRRLR